MKKDVFITGTDTGIGKTLVSCALLSILAKQGGTVLGMKPVASGCRQTSQGLRNEDAELLIRHSSKVMPYSLVNPYAYEDAIAPHLAANQSDKPIDLEKIQRQYIELSAQCDHLIVEGVGGWLVPVNATQTMADLVIMLDMPVLLVVGMRLGCINHALLSYQAIVDSGLHCIGWVANQIEKNMLCLDENIASIEQRITAPLLGRIRYQQEPDTDSMGQCLNIRCFDSI